MIIFHTYRSEKLVYIFSNMRMLEESCHLYEADEVDVEDLCPQEPDPPATVTPELDSSSSEED